MFSTVSLAPGTPGGSPGALYTGEQIQLVAALLVRSSLVLHNVSDAVVVVGEALTETYIIEIEYKPRVF